MKKKQIHIVDGKRELFLPLDDIIFVKADGNYSEIYLTNSFYPDVRIQIGQLWNQIETEGVGYPHHLERVGRSFIINLDLLIGADPKAKSITLHTEKEDKVIVIGKTPVVELLKYLKKEKRQEVLRAYAHKHILKVSLEELNDNHAYECGEEYVDLGLSSGTMWATRNVSTRRMEFTEYYGWGQLNLSDSYDEAGYKTPSQGMQQLKQLTLDLDVAHQEWQGGWRMPTEEEFRELERECVLTWCQTKDYEHGILVTGPNGNHIFLPAGGMKKGTNVVREREGLYWTSSNSGIAQKAMAVSIMDYDDENAFATVMTYTEAWSSGLSIRPILSKPTTPESPKVKTQLMINDINMLLGDKRFHKISIMHGWRMAELNLPVSPKEAMDIIKRFCDKYSPEVIVGKGSGCFYVHQLKGYKRICMGPLLHPSELFPVGKHQYAESFTDDFEFEITPEIHHQFKEMEEHQFDNIDDKNCWCLYWDEYNNDVQEFLSYYTNGAEIPELKDKRNWESTVLVPLIKEITK